eukprot:269690-Prorocentrum_minimum.AAC.1
MSRDRRCQTTYRSPNCRFGFLISRRGSPGGHQGGMPGIRGARYRTHVARICGDDYRPACPHSATIPTRCKE